MRFSCLLFFIVLFGCKKAEYSGVKVISHAGAGLTSIHSPYMDNSQEAIDYALSFEACDGVELDVQLSKDNSFWLFHDPNLKEKFDDELCISSYTDEELSAFELTNDEQLVCLNNFDFSAYPGKQFYLDFKHWTDCDSYSLADFYEGLEKMKDTEGSLVDVILLLSSKEWLDTLIASGEKVIYMANLYQEVDGVVENFPGLTGIGVKYSETNQQQVDEIREAGLLLGIFQTRAPKTIRKAINLHPDFIVSDDFKTAINIVSNGK